MRDEGAMTDSSNQPPARRDRRGRFQKGASGNPSGRPAGILNEATRTAAVLLGGEAGAWTRQALDLGPPPHTPAPPLCRHRCLRPTPCQPAALAVPPPHPRGHPPPAV